MVRILFRRAKCIGCNGCVEAAPIRWQMSKKDGRCHLLESKEKKGVFQVKIGLEEYEPNQRAAANCPMKIIQVELLRK